MIKPIVYYKLICDEPGCEARCPNSFYTPFLSMEAAKMHAQTQGWVFVGDKSYCAAHGDMNGVGVDSFG